MQHRPLVLLLSFAVAAAACQRERPRPAATEGGDRIYACDGTAMRVVYAGNAVRMTLPDGREFTLPRSQRPDKPGVEVYAGAEMVLRRLGSVVELRQRGSETIRCSESSGTT